MIYCSSSFRSISPGCWSLDHLTPPLMILNSISLMGLQRTVQTVALQRTIRPIAKSLYFISQNFGTLVPPDSWPEGCPLNNVDVQIWLRVHFCLDFCPDGIKKNNHSWILIWNKGAHTFGGDSSKSLQPKYTIGNKPYFCAHSTANCATNCATVARRW